MNHPMLNEKRIAVAVLAALHDLKQTMPTRDVVQKYKAAPCRSTQKALRAFAPHVFDEKRDVPDSILERASENLKTFRKLADNEFSKRYPTIAELWRSDAALPVYSGGNVGQTTIKKPEYTTGELLAVLNALYKKRSLLPLKKWKGSRAQLEKKIEQQKQMILKESVPAFPLLKTVVANGAYKSSREALKKTGHTERGKPKSLEKSEKRKEKIVAQQVLGEKNRFKIVVNSDGSKTPVIATGDTVTLARLAEQHGKDPKQWRLKARKHAKELARYQVNGKHEYSVKDVPAVLAYMNVDGRKK